MTFKFVLSLLSKVSAFITSDLLSAPFGGQDCVPKHFQKQLFIKMPTAVINFRCSAVHLFPSG